jgi:hypothetical protein
MSPENYKATLEGLKADLKKAKETHQALLRFAEAEEEKIAHLRQSVSALSHLCGEKFEEEDEFGLTDLVRMALRTWSGQPLTAPEVKERIEQLGYPQKSENTLASIHTILKRLVVKKEVDDSVVRDGSKTGYRWIKTLPQLDAVPLSPAEEKMREAIARTPRGRTVPPPPGSPGVPLHNATQQEEESKYEFDPLNKRGKK